ncbi:hypothetical protein [Mesorhizobium sp.]|uniref:hypothetical protein n=1 Tax=Mesorhizobium sp. TaxID=1871066 RepID=UPI000FE4EC60|nr:hypothetical protein [Mesorhizobium sp.]RWO46320.1 MAG: hypothetical protein EOS13_26830 [Mesorhizobium sp.]
MLLRMECWLTSDDHSVLRRAIAEAIWIDADSETPLVVEWEQGFFTVLVSAIEGNAFVAISSSDGVDPEATGHLLLEGQTARWQVLGGKVVIKEYRKG